MAGIGRLSKEKLDGDGSEGTPRYHSVVSRMMSPQICPCPNPWNL